MNFNSEKSQRKTNMIFLSSWFILVVLIANSAFLSYKYWQFYFGGGMINAFNCADGCDSVMLSKYALLFGIPVPFYGLAAFLLITVLYTIIHLGKINHPLLRLALDLGIGSACLAALSFLYIMYQVLHMVCKFCLLSHIGTLLFALIYFFLIRRRS